MPATLCLPENLKIIAVAPPQASSSLTTMDYVCSKNFHKIWFVIYHAGVADNDMTFQIYEATDVAAGTTAAVTAVWPCWYNQAAGTSSDTLTHVATDTYTYLVDTTPTTDQMVVIEWDPSKHTAGYDCVSLVTDAGHASNFVTVIAFGLPRYQQATPPSAIID